MHSGIAFIHFWTIIIFHCYSFFNDNDDDDDGNGGLNEWMNELIIIEQNIILLLSWISFYSLRTL